MVVGGARLYVPGVGPQASFGSHQVIDRLLTGGRTAGSGANPRAAIETPAARSLGGRS